MRSHKDVADILIVVLLFCWLGYDIGRTVEKTEPQKVEYVSPKTKCVDWDFGGKGGRSAASNGGGSGDAVRAFSV